MTTTTQTEFKQELIKGNHISRFLEQRINKNGTEICIHGVNNDFSVWSKTETSARQLHKHLTMQEAIKEGNKILSEILP